MPGGRLYFTGFVSGNSHMPPERFTQLCLNNDELVMDMGTVLDGEDAVREGLIDELGSLSDAIAALYAMIEENRAREAGTAPQKPAE